MSEGTFQTRESTLSVGIKFLTRRLGMKTKDTPVWIVIGVIILALLLFWASALVYAYVADDRSPMPADERSVPAPRSY
jgi:hypothetical protein